MCSSRASLAAVAKAPFSRDLNYEQFVEQLKTG